MLEGHGFACWTDACRAIRDEGPMNGTSRDMRRFDSEMDELSEANKSRPCFSLSYVLRIRRMSCDIARFRSTWPNYLFFSLLIKATPSRQIYEKLASCLLLRRFLSIQLLWLFVSSSAGWLMSFNCFSFSPESQRWITIFRGESSLKHLNLRLIMVSVFLP